MKAKKGLLKIPINNPEMYFSGLMIVLWTQYTIFPFIIRIVWKLPVIGAYRDYLIPVIVIVLLILSLPVFLKNVRAIDMLAYCVCAILVFGTVLFLPENGVYIMERIGKILFTGIPMFFVGLCYHHERLKKTLYFASLANVVVRLAYQIMQLASGVILLSDNMDMSYKMLPSIMFLLYWMFEHFYGKNIIVGVTAVMLSLSYGTRGPILIIFIYLIIGIYTKIIHAKTWWMRAIFVFASIGACIVFFNTYLMHDIALWLSDLFEDIGFSTRVFEMFINGSFAVDEVRNQIYSDILKAICEKPWIGYGLMGDRILLGRYVHNILLEFWCDYGFFIGSVLFGTLAGLYLKTFYHCRHHIVFYFIVSMVLMSFVRLFMSGSYVYDKNFYWVIGVCVALNRNRRKDDTIDKSTVAERTQS